MVGIYYIKNIKNNKFYIGQSSHIPARWTQHKNFLKANTHHNCHLQAAWNKYGEDSFEFGMIEECNIDELDDKETYYINKYNSYEEGYNLDLGGKGIRGYKHTPEEIAKMRMIQSPEPILQIDMQGNILHEWVSAGEAADALGFASSGGIRHCCNKDKYKTSNGYIWIYKKDLQSFNLEEHLNCANKPIPVTSYELDEQTVIKHYSSMMQAARDYGRTNTGDIAKACEGKRNTAFGVVWKYTNNPKARDIGIQKRKEFLLNKHDKKAKKIEQYTKDGELIRTWLNSELKNHEEFNLKTIQYVCMGHSKTYKNYIWKYQQQT